jgi:hypothetical protein
VDWWAHLPLGVALRNSGERTRCQSRCRRANLTTLRLNSASEGSPNFKKPFGGSWYQDRPLHYNQRRGTGYIGQSFRIVCCSDAWGLTDCYFGKGRYYCLALAARPRIEGSDPLGRNSCQAVAVDS